MSKCCVPGEMDSAHQEDGGRPRPASGPGSSRKHVMVESYGFPSLPLQGFVHSMGLRTSQLQLRTDAPTLQGFPNESLSSTVPQAGGGKARTHIFAQRKQEPPVWPTLPDFSLEVALVHQGYNQSLSRSNSLLGLPQACSHHPANFLKDSENSTG